MNFKLVISDPKTRKSYSREIPQETSMLSGKKIGEAIEGNSIGLAGFRLEITGGSDKEGFPMRKDVDGAARKKILLSSPPGYHPEREGERRRRSIRGNTVSADIVQVNLKVTEHGKHGLDELFGKKAEEKKEDKKEPKSEANEQKEEKKGEKPKEELAKKEPEKKEKSKEEKAKETEKEQKTEEKKEEKPKPEEKPKEEKA
ncbi:MAG: 30S ribosomal protein S6e [Candidatus Aenigmarchaeota archaeon]|nr:30S ribosomal protein S6e [Candidatus Aenigmarchaeota archaeon]